MSIVFLFDENPDVASAGLGGAAVGGARSVADRAARSHSERAVPSASVGNRVVALRPFGINRIAAPARAAVRGLFFTASRILPALLSGPPMTAAPVPWKDELVRACVHEVENHRALGVVAHVGVSARRAGPHAVGCRSGRARLERNQRRSPSQRPRDSSMTPGRSRPNESAKVQGRRRPSR